MPVATERLWPGGRSEAWGTTKWLMGGSGLDERRSPRTDIIFPCKVQGGCGEGEGVKCYIQAVEVFSVAMSTSQKAGAQAARQPPLLEPALALTLLDLGQARHLASPRPHFPYLLTCACVHFLYRKVGRPLLRGTGTEMSDPRILL